MYVCMYRVFKIKNSSIINLKIETYKCIGHLGVGFCACKKSVLAKLNHTADDYYYFSISLASSITT